MYIYTSSKRHIPLIFMLWILFLSGCAPTYTTTSSEGSISNEHNAIPSTRGSLDIPENTDNSALLADDTISTSRSPSSFGNISGSVDERRQNTLADTDGSAFVGALEIRNYNGMYNNQAETAENWGASFSPLQRLSSVDYGDRVATLAEASRKNPREISLLVASQRADTTIVNTFGTSDFLWQWGQFIDHDLSLTEVNNEVANIAIPRSDRIFDPTQLGGRFITFKRAQFDPHTNQNTNNPRQQENEMTSWIDGSIIYGTYPRRMHALREGPDSPFLQVDEHRLLPKNTLALANANGPFPVDP